MLNFGAGSGDLSSKRGVPAGMEAVPGGSNAGGSSTAFGSGSGGSRLAAICSLSSSSVELPTTSQSSTVTHETLPLSEFQKSSASGSSTMTLLLAPHQPTLFSKVKNLYVQLSLLT